MAIQSRGALQRARKGAFAIAFMALAAYLVKLGAHMLATEETDDAYVTAHVHPISARVQGVVSQIFVDENDAVKKGDVLVQLDPNDYIIALKIAQANYSKAHKDLGRLGGVHEFLPDEKPIYDQYTANALTSDAELDRARLNLNYTRVVAPTDGKIGKRSVELGQSIAAGQSLMALVEPNPWIIANFKEAQTARILPGQQVEIHIDAISERDFDGIVESVAPASGATFSLLPPDNATGNFTKIVQRVPVKILFDPQSIKGFESRVGAGMSTEVTIYPRRALKPTPRLPP